MGLCRHRDTLWEIFAACLGDRAALADAQAKRNIVDAEECLRPASYTDVKPMLAAYRASGSAEKITAEREATRRERGEIAATAYA